MSEESQHDVVAAYAVREIVLPRRPFRSIKLFEVAGTPRGAQIPAFHLRTPHAVAFLTGQSWPAVLMGSNSQLDEATAGDLVERAQAAPEVRRSVFSRSETESAWVATADSALSPPWPVLGADRRRDLMAAQWVAEWFSHLLPESATHSAYALIAQGKAGEALELLATTAVGVEAAVPRRYFEALKRLVHRLDADPGMLNSVEALVPDSDDVWTWSELVDIPRVRARWVGAPHSRSQRPCEIEFTPRHTAAPEWIRQMTKSSSMIESLLGREFGGELNIRLADDRFNANPEWISLFPQDNI